ncbi:hypothetical protein GCM10010300_44750 [Streptomyces olivaceoviridis]|nr:hypothetical protein GCM10010300_44750 [Streptomyces olivaceoviridis]
MGDIGGPSGSRPEQPGSRHFGRLSLALTPAFQSEADRVFRGRAGPRSSAVCSTAEASRGAVVRATVPFLSATVRQSSVRRTARPKEVPALVKLSTRVSPRRNARPLRLRP